YVLVTENSESPQADLQVPYESHAVAVVRLLDYAGRLPGLLQLLNDFQLVVADGDRSLVRVAISKPDTEDVGVYWQVSLGKLKRSRQRDTPAQLPVRSQVLRHVL